MGWKDAPAVQAASRWASAPKVGPPQAGPPSTGEIIGRGIGQGLTLGTGDELAGAFAAGQKQIERMPELKGVPDADLYALAMSEPSDYRQARDAGRAIDEAAQKEGKWRYAGGQLLGAVPLAAATGGGGLARLILTGAGMGALSGAGESKADTTGGVLADAAEGGAVGGALPAAFVGVGKAMPVLDSTLRSGANATGRRILRNVGGSIAAKVPVPDEAIQEAFNSGVFKPFGTSKGAASRLETIRATLGDQKARIMSALENAGITGPQADALAQQYAGEAMSTGATSMNPSVPRVFESAAEQVGSKPTVRGRLSLTQAEDLKQSLQDMADSAYRQLEPNELAQAKKGAASMMRQGVEDAIDQQTANASPATRAIAEQFVPLKQRLGKIIAASDVAREGMARAANRQAFSLKDALMAQAGAGAGAFVNGVPGAVLGGPISAIGSYLLRTRGPSTAATAMQGGANALDWLTQQALTPSQAQTQAIIDAIVKRSLPAASEVSGARVVE